MSPTAADEAHISREPRLGGVVFAKLYPNPSEPFRGSFVADQVHATSDSVRWEVVAPVPLVPRVVADAFGKPYAGGTRDDDGVTVHYSRYAVLPKRIMYATVPAAMVAASRSAFTTARAAVGADFVHAHELFPSGEAARRLAAEAGLPYVLTVHGSDLYLNLDNPRWRAGVQRAADGAAALVCVGSRLASDCIEILGVDPSKVLVVPNTYDTARFVHIERPEHDGPLRLLSVGRLSPEKGHEVLLRAFSELWTGGMDAELVLVGDGSERSRLAELAAELGISDRVEFTGVVLGDDLAARMAWADVFVLPSHEEGFGVVLIEAMATGLPVVATRSGGPEDLVDEAGGVLVGTGDPSAFAAGVRGVAGRLTEFDSRAIAARTAERFSPAAVGERLARLYREVVNGSPIADAVAQRRDATACTCVVMFASRNAYSDPRIAKEADALVDEGYDVTVLAWDRTGAGGAEHPPGGWRVEHLGPRAVHGGGVRNLIGFRAFWRDAGARAAALGAEVLHCHDLDTVPAALAARKQMSPAPRWVLDFWEMYRESRMLPQKGVPGVLARAAARVIERRSIPHADFVVTVCEGQVEYYESLGARKVVLVENAPVLDNYRPVERHDDDFVVSFIGRKRYLPALTSLMEAVQPHPQLKALLVGGGPAEAAVAEAAAKLERVEVSGNVPNSEIGDLYQRCDAVFACYDISLSNWRTAFPVKVMEGMACALPVIVTKGSWVAEFVARERLGVAVDHLDPADVERGLLELSGDREAAREMGRRGRRIVESELNWDAAAQRLLGAYSEMLGE